MLSSGVADQPATLEHIDEVLKGGLLIRRRPLEWFLLLLRAFLRRPLRN